MKKIACVVLPTYNEIENIKRLIPRIYLTRKHVGEFELHVLVVDDNSPDGTGIAVKELMQTYSSTLHLLSGKKRGLGIAYKRGLSYGVTQLKADVIMQMDADLQHDPALLPLFFDHYASGFSVIIGSRFAPGGSTPNFSMFRRGLSRTGNELIRKICRLKGFSDLTSGYRCINADLIRACNFERLPERGYSFTMAFLVELIRNGARVLEIPITFPRRIHSTSKLTLFDLLEFLVTLGRISSNR